MNFVSISLLEVFASKNFQNNFVKIYRLVHQEVFAGETSDIGSFHRCERPIVQLCVYDCQGLFFFFLFFSFFFFFFFFWFLEITQYLSSSEVEILDKV